MNVKRYNFRVEEMLGLMYSNNGIVYNWKRWVYDPFQLPSLQVLSHSQIMCCVAAT